MHCHAMMGMVMYYSFFLPFVELGSGNGTYFELLLKFLDKALGASKAEEQRERRREAIDWTIQSSVLVLTNRLFTGITVLPFFGVNRGFVLALPIPFWSSEFISNTFFGFVMSLLALTIPPLWFSSISNLLLKRVLKGTMCKIFPSFPLSFSYP